MVRQNTFHQRNGQRIVTAPSAETSQALRRILKCLNAVQKGKFSVRLPSDWTGLEGKVADSLNEIIAANERMAKELKRVSRMVGKQGRIAQRAAFDTATGAWKGMEESVNSLITDLVWPTLEVTRTI